MIVATLLVGAVLRLREYAADRSLWLDESFLAVNLLRRGFGSIFGVLDFNQGAAPGFLLLEKTAASIQPGEQMLRVAPLLFGLASLVLVAALAHRVSAPAAAPVACVLTALAPGLVYYSNEVKQYSADVAACLALTLAAVVLSERATRRGAVLAALGGVAAIAVSQAAVMAAGGIGCVLVAQRLVERRRPDLPTSLVVAAWAAAAAGVLSQALRTTQGVLRSYVHSDAFVGSGAGGSVTNSFTILPTRLAGDLGLPTGGGGFRLVTEPACLLAAIGFVALARRRPWRALLVVAPVAVTYAVSLGHRYPVSGRTVLFLVPAAAICLAEAAALPLRLRGRRAGPAVAALLLALPLQAAVRADAHTFVHPTRREELRPLLAHVAPLARTGDRLYVVYSAQYALAYYALCGCATDLLPWRFVQARAGSGQWAPALRSTQGVAVQPYLGEDDNAYLELVKTLAPGRTWVLLAHTSDDAERRFFFGPFLDAFARRGRRLAAVAAPGAEAVLFDLR